MRTAIGQRSAALSKVDSPDKDSVQIGTDHYNNFAKDFEQPWPFGPYSSN